MQEEKQVKALSERLKSIDVSKLVEYSRKIKDIGSLNHMMAPAYLRDFIMAYDYTNSMLSVAVRCDAEASSHLDSVKAIAYLDRAGEYLESKGIKDSAESRKRYVDIDEDVIKAQDIRAKTTALVVFLKNKLQAFRMAHDDVKKMVYGDSYQTPNEGF
jgi:hypothetical protein